MARDLEYARDVPVPQAASTRTAGLPLVIKLAVVLLATLTGCAFPVSRLSTSSSTPPAATAAPPATSVAPVNEAASGTRVPVPLTVPAQFRTGALAVPRTLTLPVGYQANVFVAGLKGPRFMAIGPSGIIFVTSMIDGLVYALPDRNNDGVADDIRVWADGLRLPHGIVYRDNYLYVAETHRIVRFRMGPDGARLSSAETIVPNLPEGGNHVSRTIGFGTDGRLFVAVGSTCDICVEQDQRRATISVYNGDGSNGRVYMRGLRNAVGFVTRPGTSEIWATNNGRDEIGDNLPFETVYRIRDGGNAGWPLCIAGAGGLQPDPQFGKPDSCQGVDAPQVTIQAHSAPLGLRFYDGTNFPQTMRDSLFVALHGSWNRTVPTGYKVVRVPFSGNATGEVEDFATGWLAEEGKYDSIWGRPVDVIVAPGGSLLVSDDSTAGAIYRITYG